MISKYVTKVVAINKLLPVHIISVLFQFSRHTHKYVEESEAVEIIQRKDKFLYDPDVEIHRVGHYVHSNGSRNKRSRNGNFRLSTEQTVARL